jgi:hypothetical protein
MVKFLLRKLRRKVVCCDISPIEPSTTEHQSSNNANIIQHRTLPAKAMAPAVTSPVPGASFAFGSRSPRKRESTVSNEEMSGTLFRQSTHVSHRVQSTVETTNLSQVVYSLKRRGSEELGSDTSAKLFNATHDSIIEWIRTQRMQRLPPEGSSQDRVLAWAQLFVERLHSFDQAIAGFAGDSYLATQLAYGYCAILLELGEENAPALMLSFGFFYNMSVSLVNLLERTELFSVDQDVREQLVLALSDLVTLVASVSTYFHRAINGLTTTISVNIYNTFPTEIKSFVGRCEKTAESMWRHQLVKEGIDGSRVSIIKSIRGWLTPEDHALYDVVKAASHLAHDREELTCLWVAPHLTRFLRGSDTSLSITGAPGSGKTVLSSVIVDHLQHPIGGVSYNAIFVPINKRIPAEATRRAVAKSILYQLFERRIGNVQLLEILSDAHEETMSATSEEDYDGIIWAAVENALAATLPGTRELVMVVDGTDEISGDESLLLQQLNKAATNGIDVKLITLGGKQSSTTAGQAHVQVTEDIILDDIVRVIRGQFDHDKEFCAMRELEKETIVTRLAQSSKGSFLWAKLATKRLRLEKSVDSLRKAIDSLIEAKPTVTDFISETLHSSRVSEEAKLMVIWLATAERPLSLKELATLSSIQIEKDSIDNQNMDVLTVLKPVISLVFLQDGLVYLRHSTIRAVVLDMCKKGKLSPHVNDSHHDLARRALFYIKKNVTLQHEPSMTGLSSHETSQLLSKHSLMDFAIRYWPMHMRQTSVYLKDGELAAMKTFAQLLPSSVPVLLLQDTVWHRIATPVLLAYQKLVANSCRHNLGPKSPATLQSVMSLAMTYRQLNHPRNAIPCFYEASTLSNTLLSPRHTLTLQIAQTFLELTSMSTTTTRTEIMNRREEVLLILVECNKIQYGQNSETVVTVLHQLAEHYRFIKEEQKAMKITESITAITATEAAERDPELHVHLRGRQETERAPTGASLNLDFEEHDELIEGTESYDFEFFLKRAEKYVSEGRTELAERSYIDMWHRVNVESHSHSSEVWQQRKLKAVVCYSKYLQSQKKEVYASSLLSSAWEDYRQSSTVVTETTVSYFHEMAKVMKSVGLTSASLNLLKRCSQYYQSTSGTQSAVYREIQHSIQTDSHELMQSISSSSHVMSEATLEEMVLEASKSAETMNEVAFRATFHLVSLYMSQHRWQDATRIIKKVQRSVWPSYFTLSVRDVEPPIKSVEACVELADRLAECHRARRRLAKEEDVRLRVYYALRSNRSVDDGLRSRATTQILGFYDRTSQKDKLINVRQEMLDDFTKARGPEDQMVVKMLWELADLTRPRPIFIEYYQTIIRVLNKNSDVATEETFEPISVVANELWNKGMLTDALRYHRILFATFLKKPSISAKFQDESFMREVFTRYDNCLRSVRSDYEVLRKVSVEYQTQCKAMYGASSSITIRATLHLAQIYQESKTYEHEAIAIYQELLKTKSSEIDHKEVSAILEVMYEEHADVSVLTKSESVSSTQLSQAVTILRKRVEQVRKSYGWAHEESLSKLTELVKLHSRQQDTEKVLSELNTTTVHVLSTETSSTRLIAAASTVASCFIASNQVKKATEIKAELYRQIIMKDKSNAGAAGFDLTSRGRESLVFLAQFEYDLRRSSATVNEILSELTTHYVYFDEFKSLMRSKSSNIQSVTTVTARLYNSLIKGQRPLAASRVFDDYYQYFFATEAKRINLNTPSQGEILLRTLLQHFSNHRSRDFVRSVAISGIEGVVRLLEGQRDESACDLALACFTYISAHNNYRTPEMARLVLVLGMRVADRSACPNPEKANYKQMLEASGLILRDVLQVLADMSINLESISISHLSRLVELLGEQKDFATLSWLLTALWNSREAQQNWSPSTTFALGKQVILARYLVGETTSAVRLAEDIVYNCRRVHGTRHPSTLDMSVFLAQLYTSVAQRLQGERAGKEMAGRYYKKSAAIHENILRVFSDPSYADMDGSPCSSPRIGSHGDGGGGRNTLMGDVTPTEQRDLSEGAFVRQHLWHLKLALERLGGWANSYGEYERLNADVFRQYAAELQGVEGVERWNLDGYGAGKAESQEDLLDVDVQTWGLLDPMVSVR